MMQHDDLEDTYAALALKIDAVGPEQSPLFLAKLALLLAHKIGDPAVVHDCIESAAAALEGAGQNPLNLLPNDQQGR